MTLEEYNRLDRDFAHCSGANCERAGECLHHTAYKMLDKNTYKSYTATNPAVITGEQPCPLFIPDQRETYAWGISTIYDNVRTSELRHAKLEVMSCFGAATYYKVKQQRRAITKEEQQAIRQAFTDMGYNGSAIEFDRYEQCYPALMRLKRRK